MSSKLRNYTSIVPIVRELFGFNERSAREMNGSTMAPIDWFSAPGKAIRDFERDNGIIENPPPYAGKREDYKTEEEYIDKWNETIDIRIEDDRLYLISAARVIKKQFEIARKRSRFFTWSIVFCALLLASAYYMYKANQYQIVSVQRGFSSDAYIVNVYTGEYQPVRVQH